MDADLDELRCLAAEVGALYIRRFGVEADGAFHLGKLAEELGEMTSAWLKLNGRARGTGDRRALEDEAADLFGFLLLFADWQGIDLAAALQRKWGAYAKEEPAR